ncbi:DNA-processing protein DprA [Candidatus Saccharibacteria bacterium]|nr:DNA-processing protein DprA [Candidatus Saccharibacteria bacterium]MCL1963395.1 DNA-processing protein DprA [Candidatus Saccharibacteria bacterium]
MKEINNISPDQHKFLQRTSVIDNPAKCLWFQGNLPENWSEMPIVAIVGSRKPTEYGKNVTLRLAAALAAHNVIIVSGLAIGHDSLAARGALDGGGITIGVVGNGLNNQYPRTTWALREEILEKGGAVISEYSPETPVYPGNYLLRNRLISALSDVVIVVEAGEKSGTLNTAMHALNQGKELMAVPGNITSPLSVGCNRLIASGAGIVLGADDVLEKLREIFSMRAGGESVAKQISASISSKVKDPTLSQPITASDTSETKILKLLTQGVIDGDEIMRRAHLSVVEYNTNLTMLEINGQVRALGANRWTLR